MSSPGHDHDYQDRLRRESERWAHLGTDRHSRPTWLESSLVQRHVNRQITGDEDLHWWEGIQHQILPRSQWGGRGLNLGCNDGQVDRVLMRLGVCESFDGFDISAHSIEIAAQEAAREGLAMNYAVADINTIELEPGAYRLVVVMGALHHFEALEHVYRQVHAAMETDGLFVFNEFVGPARFQWTDRQLELANALRAELPPELLLGRDGTPVPRIERPDLEHFARTDPFEAIRSDEILPLAEEHFKILGRRDYGGTVLQLAFDSIIQNFDEANPEHAAIVRDFCERERRWIEAGELGSDHTLVVAARKDSSYSF